MNQIFERIDIKNLAPGALIYRGKKIVEPFSVEVIHYNESTALKKEFVDADEALLFLKTIKMTDQNVTWINITGINHVDEITKIGHAYGISNIILEQILTITKHSMYKLGENFIYNDLQMIYIEGETVKHENISLYKQQQHIITFQEVKGDIFDTVRERIIGNTGFIRQQGLSYLYFSLLDALVDHYLDVLEKAKVDVDLLEEKVTNLEVLNIQDIHGLRKLLMTIKFGATPLEKLGQIFMNDTHILNMEDGIFIESLYDHIRQIMNELLIQKETVDGLFENYMLNNSNDMNTIMTTLTIFSAIFIPLTFIAGIFGMNFQVLPGLDNPYGFYYFLGGCVVTAVMMVGFFKLKKWF